MSLLDRVLILGGAGMLAHAFKRLLPPPAAVSAPGRLELDITDPAALSRHLDTFRPTLILNCAAHTKVDLCDYQIDLARLLNATAPARAAGLAARLGLPFAHFSTDFVFSPPSPTDAHTADIHPRPWRESDPTSPASVYGLTKLEGEHAVAAAHPQALILRTSWLFGPGGNSFPLTMLRAARAGKPLSVVADQTGSPTLTLDLARATLDLLARNATGLFHASNAGETTWHAFAAATLDAFGVAPPGGAVTPLTSADWKARIPHSAVRPSYSTLDCSKLAAALGRPMPHWKDALAEFRTLMPDA